jgi:hypothetical protein
MVRVMANEGISVLISFNEVPPKASQAIFHSGLYDCKKSLKIFVKFSRSIERKYISHNYVSKRYEL